jgi:hypothetical protein
MISIKNSILQELFSDLELTEDDLFYYPELKPDRYICDYCDKKTVDKVIAINDVKKPDACISCFNHLGLQKADINNLRNRDETYVYEIIYTLKLAANEWIYVVYEHDNNNTIDCHYYLKYYKNGWIILDHELQSYNPYYGCEVESVTINNDLVTIRYEEKHCFCEVTLKPETTSEKFTKRLLYSVPGSSSRLMKPETKSHEIGEIIQFIKDEKEMVNKTYWT